MDEYDTCLNNALVTLKEEESKKVKRLFADFFRNTFKTNSYFEKGLMTGILPIAKEDLFSDLNNVSESGMYSKAYSKFYGFSEEEFNRLCSIYKVPDNLKESMKNWYNGYRIQDIKIYNPWSVMKALTAFSNPYITNIEVEVIKKYWVESGSFSFLDKFFQIPEVIEDIELLCQGNSINIEYNESISFNDFNSLNKAISSITNNNKFIYTIKNLFFSFLYSAGYLTSDETSYSADVSKLKLYLINKIQIKFYKFILNNCTNSKNDYSQQ